MKLFLKIKKGLELVSLPHFLHNFWREIFLLLYSIYLPNFIVWLPLLCEILGNIYIAIICKPVCDVMNFEVNLIFLINPFFLTWPKRAFNQANNTHFFGRWESDFNNTIKWKCNLENVFKSLNIGSNSAEW